MAAPDLLDPKAAVHNSKPRLSFSTKPVVLNTPEDDCDTRTTVMRWKTVSAIFFLVVLYLIIGATVFRALEQPHESSLKLAILAEKLEFLALHSCVNSTELEDLVKASVIFYFLPTNDISWLRQCSCFKMCSAFIPIFFVSSLANYLNKSEILIIWCNIRVLALELLIYKQNNNYHSLRPVCELITLYTKIASKKVFLHVATYTVCISMWFVSCLQNMAHFRQFVE